MKNIDGCAEFIIDCLNNKTPPQISVGDLTLPQGEGYIQDTSYRPFDVRKIYYDTKTKDIIERAGTKIMQHLFNHENVGLAFCRQINQEFYHCFVSNKTGEITSIAPLYLYKKEKVMGITTEAKLPNFKPEFVKMLNSHFNSFNNFPP